MVWIGVAAERELREAGWLEVEAAGRAILLVRTASGCFAASAVCPHQTAWFSQGKIEGETLFCPRHQGAFDVRTGRRLAGPLCPDLPVHKLRCAGGRIFVLLPDRP